MRKLIIPFLAIILVAQTSCTNEKPAATERKAVGLADVKIDSPFWNQRLETSQDSTLKACLDICEIYSGRMHNFKVAAGKEEGEFIGVLYDDSDVYKVLEGVGYSLTWRRNDAMEERVDTLIDIIAAAQQPDGYINTYFTVAEPENKWKTMDLHESYCGGHLIEAGIAYYHATGKRKLLDVGIKFADHLCDTFGEGKRDWVSGHQEIELAMMKLYHETGDAKYKDWAEWEIEERGKGVSNFPAGTEDGHLDRMPVAQLRVITGHAVRAMYMMSAMTDVEMEERDSRYSTALDSIWEDIVMRNMYITGGIGSSNTNEGFTHPYDLPNDKAYCETCASCGMLLWNSRMNLWKGDAKYADIVEKEMYNGALDGVSINGKKFFYENPLAADGTRHRQDWYWTACCPTQICRFVPCVGNYIATTHGDTLTVNQYIGCSLSAGLDSGKDSIEIKTNYPWDGDVELTVREAPSRKSVIVLRIPEWCDSYSLKVNGKEVKADSAEGYMALARRWKAGDKVSLTMDMPVKVVAADPRVKADEGRRAIMRGPLVYCLEDADNAGLDWEISGKTEFTASFESDFLNGLETIVADNGNQKLKFIPYFAWDNREAGKMEVWIPYDSDKE